MKKIIFIIAIILTGLLKSYSMEFEGIYDNNTVIYSPSNKYWSKNEIYKDGILLEKHIDAKHGNNSDYTYGCGEIILNSDYEFIYKGRFIGADNKNLKFNEIIYEECEFKEIPLKYEQIQQIFGDIPVIKLSDFNDGSYTILNNKERNEIIIYNDTTENLTDYEITPKASIINKDIKSKIQINRRGKIVLYNPKGKDSKRYTIRVR